MDRPARCTGSGRALTRHIVLIGLPGAGKTTVAVHAAQLLGAACCDLDDRVTLLAGKSVNEIFDVDGEPVFRQLEHDAMERALAEPPQVIAAGGGWAAQPGNMAAAELRALLIYLSISPATAARRIRSSVDRPLLRSADLVARLTTLLEQREEWYRFAAVEVAVDTATPETAAAAVATAARQYAGW